MLKKIINVNSWLAQPHIPNSKSETYLGMALAIWEAKRRGDKEIEVILDTKIINN